MTGCKNTFYLLLIEEMKKGYPK